LIAGSSGVIGTALREALAARGDEVVRLVRPESPGSGVPWDPAAGLIDSTDLEGFDAVVNLAGRSIGERRWTETEKRLVMDSRVDSTSLLANALADVSSPPKVLVNASAVGYYGDGGDAVLDESSPAGDGFLAGVCVAWEAATRPASDAGIRVAMPRTGIVLSTDGGALGRLLAPLGPSWLSPYRWGLGGVVGRGRQWWSWISLDDEIRALLHLIDSDVAGPVNLVAPEPTTHRAFIKALGRALRRPTVVPIPPFVVKVLIGSELAEALVLEGQRVVPTVLLDSGFEFQDADLETALRDALAG
jgi:uncharacterized protein (TIGR01777 family)